MSAPERIWADLATDEDENGLYGEWHEDIGDGTEYIRADLATSEADALRAETRKLALEVVTASREAMELHEANKRLRETVKSARDLIKGDAVGSEWKRGCADFLRQARVALKGDTHE